MLAARLLVLAVAIVAGLTATMGVLLLAGTLPAFIVAVPCGLRVARMVPQLFPTDEAE